MRLHALTEKDTQRIHKKTLKILHEKGVRVKSKRARELLLQAGATAAEGEWITIPEKLVSRCLKTVPSSFLLGARNQTYDFPVPAKRPGHTIDGAGTGIIDLETGERRESRKQDVADLARVFQSMETGVAAWCGCTANDVPPETQYIHEFAALIQSTSKHMQIDFRTVEESPYMMDILRTVLKSDEEIKERKLISLVYCPISPLAHNDEMLDGYFTLAKYEVPICLYPCPIMGLTSPASVFSTLCQINAENLSSIVIYQLNHPGTPILYGLSGGSVDRVTGDYIYNVESTLLSMGAVAMARYYGMPCEVTGADLETLPTYLAWPDVIDGYGTTDGAMTSDMELMVIQDEIAKRIYRIMDGIDTGEDKDFTEDIIQKAESGNFLSCKSTRKMMRDKSELYYSKLFPDTEAGPDEMWDIAHEHVLKLLKEPMIDPLPQEAIKEIDTICKRADRELAK